MFSQPFKYHGIEEDVLPTSVTLTRADALSFYKQMVTIRRMEQEASKLYKEKVIRGFCHLYSGQVRIDTVVSSFSKSSF